MSTILTIPDSLVSQSTKHTAIYLVGRSLPRMLLTSLSLNIKRWRYAYNHI